MANADEVIKLIRKRAVQDKIEADIDEEAWDAVFTMDVRHAPVTLFTIVAMISLATFVFMILVVLIK